MTDGISDSHDIHTVLLTDSQYSDHELEREIIAAAGGRLTVHRGAALTEKDVLNIPELSGASVLLVELAPITAAVLHAAAQCKVVVRYGTGLDNVDLAAAREAGIEVLGIPGYAAESVSDHTMALLLALARSIHQTMPIVGRGGWRGHESIARPISLAGLRLGLVGAGAIAMAVGRKAQAFGLHCVAFDPFVEPEVLRAAGIEPASLASLLSSSDIISLHAPLNDETRHLINADSLATVKQGAILLNTARGGLVDEAALIDALDAGRLHAAGLDVTDPEPPSSSSSLRSHPAILLTPHMAFWSDSSELALRTAVAQIAASKLVGRETRDQNVVGV